MWLFTDPAMTRIIAATDRPYHSIIILVTPLTGKH
jgi:hypothetical protein